MTIPGMPFPYPTEYSTVGQSLTALDPTWETITRLFPGQTGMKILLAILASAGIVQRTLPTWGLVDVAVLHCQNLATFAQQLGCGKDTLLRYIKLYQTLGLLTHSRTGRQRRSATELSLPLTPYEPSSEILERLNVLVSQGRKKQQDLARFVRDRYRILYHLPLHASQETWVQENPVHGLLTRTAHLLQKKRVSRIERQALHDEIMEVVVHLEKHPQGDLPAAINAAPVFLQRLAQGDQPSFWEDPEAPQGDQSAGKGDLPVAVKQPGDQSHKKGDFSSMAVKQPGDQSHKEGDLPCMGEVQLEDRSHKEGDLLRVGETYLEDQLLKKGDLLRVGEVQPEDQSLKKGDLRTGTIPQSEDLTLFKGDFSAQNSDDLLETGDLNVMDEVPSSIDSSFIKDSSQKEFELESKISEQWMGSEQELSQEAITYLTLLDGSEYATPDYVSTHAGKKALAGYKNKLRRDPRLARIAAVNTLLQRTFYDLTKQKKPLENAGKWFHSSFDRYADQQRPMEITGEILDWAKSPYTLEEIAFVLRRERKRQETQWWPSESPHLPFSSCVVTYQHLRDKASEIRMNVSEGDQDAFTAETARQEAGEAMEPPSAQWMSCDEAEQLANEINHEASWYLYEIQVHPEPRLGEHAYIVEASIAETTFSVVYASRQEWWQDHQQQLKHQIWKEQQREKKTRTHFSPIADPRIAAM